MQLENRGASLLEMMFVLAILALAMPFAYQQMSSVRDDIKIMSYAKTISGYMEPIKNFARLHANEFPEDEPVPIEPDDNDENKRIFILKTDENIWAFLLMKKIDPFVSHKLAGFIGTDAAVVEDDKIAYSSGGWAINVEEGELGDLVLRTQIGNQKNNSEQYLHRTIIGDGELATMKRDLIMNNFSLANINNFETEELGASNLDSYLVKAGLISTGTLYFADGVNLNPEKSIIPVINVSGDANGFRNIYTDDFNSPLGSITSDRTAVTKELIVAKDFEVKSETNRSSDGFAGASANIVRCSYLDTDTLTILPGSGLTVSSELLYSATPPVKIGSWSFPSSAGPRITSLKLGNIGMQHVNPDMPDFGDINKSGWQ